jgi:hypothetical protein
MYTAVVRRSNKFSAAASCKLTGTDHMTAGTLDSQLFVVILMLVTTCS